MKKELTKFHVALPKESGRLVAAETHTQALKACFPELEFEILREGHKWKVYKSSEELPKGWPLTLKGGGGGTTLNVEDLGSITVMIDD